MSEIVRKVSDSLGRPLRDLRISVIDQCNFRCTYCMPAELFGERYAFLAEDKLLSFEEIARLARLFAALGVRKIKLTGGEPLLREWLPRLVRLLADTPGIEDLALITNGYHLAPLARRLKEAGLRRVSVSLDSLRQEVFGAISGRGYRVQRVLDAIRAAQQEGLTPVKVNMVVMRDLNEGEVVDFVRFFRGTGCIVRFIEFMDVGNRNHWRQAQVVPSAELLQRIGREFPLQPVEAGYRGEVAERYRLADGSAEIGFISSVSQPFCRGCTRARLTADGKLFTCLFANAGTDLREPLRRGETDAQLLERIRGTWQRRADRYSEERTAGSAPPSGPKVEMYHIGG